MKTLIKAGILLVLIMAAALLMQCHVPYYARKAHDRIEQGMHINDVVRLLADAVVKPTLCQWRHEGNQEYLPSNRGECRVPAGINLSSYRTELTVLFMGPGFLHNDFIVNFAQGGTVSDISEFKQWD